MAKMKELASNNANDPAVRCFPLGRAALQHLAVPARGRADAGEGRVAGHPAIPFLLLAIADDALGLVALAVFYPSGPLSPSALAGLMPAVLAAMWLRRRRTQSFWAYVIGPGASPGLLSTTAGFHPAPALVPIVPFMPHRTKTLRWNW